MCKQFVNVQISKERGYQGKCACIASADVYGKFL